MNVVHTNKRSVYKNLEIAVPWCGSLCFSWDNVLIRWILYVQVKQI